jgi:hypothetical protein
MFRPLYMAIFRFSIRYSVRKCQFLVGRGGGARSLFTSYGWYRSHVLGALPGFGLLLLSIYGVLHMGGDCFRSGSGGYALFHGFCVVIIRLSSGWLSTMLIAVVRVTHLNLCISPARFVYCLSLTACWKLSSISLVCFV